MPPPPPWPSARALLLALLLGALPAAAQERGPELSLASTSVSYSSFFRGTPGATSLQLAAEWALPERLSPLRVAAGLRATLPMAGVAVPLEGFVRLRVAARLGLWEPAVGPELGLSGLARLASRWDRLPEDIDTLEAERLGPGYLAISAAPLRVRLGEWSVSALELQVGTVLPRAGSAVRLQLGLLGVGVAL